LTKKILLLDLRVQLRIVFFSNRHQGGTKLLPYGTSLMCSEATLMLSFVMRP
jgi:hypothetical protein